MKKIIFILMLVIGCFSFARDYTFNAKRDITYNNSTNTFYCTICERELTPDEVMEHVSYHQELEREERKGN